MPYYNLQRCRTVFCLGIKIIAKLRKHWVPPMSVLVSTFICTLYTADMPAIVKGGDDYLQCLVYADDLAICSNNLCDIQQSIDRLYKYCSDNYLGINIGKTKIMKFRRGGHLAKSDVIPCNSNPIEFVSKYTYLGVVFQTKGLTGHFDHLRNKGIAACAKVAARMPGLALADRQFVISERISQMTKRNVAAFVNLTKALKRLII